MKRITFILSIFAFSMTFSGSAFAQTADVTASASIVADLSVTKNTDLSFGQILNSQTADAVIDPNDTNSGTGSTTTLGKVTVVASDGAGLSISFTNPTDLSLTSDATQKIGFTGNYTGKETDDAATSTDLNESTANEVTLGSANDTYYIYLGGTLDGADIDGATTGTYEGTITVTVNYL